VNHTVGISEMKISNQVDDVLVTYFLGSCIGLSLYDPIVHVGGLIHCMLPLSKIDPVKAKSNPQMFVFELGAERRRLVAKVAGAAMLLDDKRLFKIGERNYTVLRKLLRKNNISIAAEDVGGMITRTMYLYIATGRTIIKSGGWETEL